MIFEAKNNRQVCLRILCGDDTDYYKKIFKHIVF